MISDKRVTELCASVQRGENSLGTAIRTACAEAVAIEREECAKEVEFHVMEPASMTAAHYIRARGKVR